MHPFFRNDYKQRAFLSAVLAIALGISLLSSSAVAWQQGSSSPTSSAAVAAKSSVSTLTPVERKAAARIKLETIREVTTTLSSPQFEGRGTGQPGADRAAQYIADRFAKLGLKPAGDNGTFLQAIKFKSAQVLATTSVKIGDAALKHGQDFVILPPYNSEQVDACKAPGAT